MTELNLIKDCEIGDGVKIYNFCNLYGCEIGEGTQIASFVTIQKKAKIGRNCKIGDYVFIPEGSDIGNFVFIGAGTKLCNDLYPEATNEYGELKKEYDWNLKPVHIMDSASIGINCTILPGVTIGSDSLIGAGSVVTKDIPHGEIWVGNPAKFLRKNESSI